LENQKGRATRYSGRKTLQTNARVLLVGAVVQITKEKEYSLEKKKGVIKKKREITHRGLEDLDKKKNDKKSRG